MANLITFGCSYTEGFDGVGIADNLPRYFNFLGYKPKSWNQFLAEKINYNLINLGNSGRGNDLIFMTFVNNIDKIKENDIVIYQFTFMERFMKANAAGDAFEHPVPFTFVDSDKEFSKNTQEEIQYNRSMPVWLNQIKTYEKIIEYVVESKKAKLFFWSGDNRIIYESHDLFDITKPKYLLAEFLGKPYKYANHMKDYFDLIEENGGKTIREETNGEINDGHLSEKGHKITSEFFYNHLIKHIDFT